MFYCELVHFIGGFLYFMILFIFLSFGLVALILFGSLIIDSIQVQSLFLLAIFLLLSFLFYSQVIKEWTKSKKRLINLHSVDLKPLFFLLLGTFASFFINHNLGMGAVIGSSVVGLIGSLLFKPHATSIYCGSFIGMACSIIFANPLSLVTAAVVSSILFVLSKDVLIGYGGKLGFLAFSGCYVASVLFQTPFRVVSPLTSEWYPFIFMYVIGASLATFAVQKEWKLDAVQASALVGLTLALIHPDSAHTVVVAAFCATFTGMMSPEKVKGYREMFVLSLITSILFIAAFSLFDGSGGKLGSIAFLSTVSGLALVRYSKQVINYIIKKKKDTPSSSQI